MSRPFWLGPLALALVVLSGCGGEKRRPEVPRAPVPVAETTLTSGEVVATTPVSPSIAISDALRVRCQLDIGDVTRAPTFDFDESVLLPADYEILSRIAQCVTVGPLAARPLKLIGRADPRGPTDYNLALGARRAHSVAAFFVQLGVVPALLHETSRGELDARGYDEATWRHDRRVDIVLAEE